MSAAEGNAEWTVEAALAGLESLHPLSPPTGRATAPLAFLHIIDRLKHIPRTGWVNNGIEKPETIASHMYRMGILAMLCPDESVDRDRCVRMALVHDIAESVVGDFTPSDPITKEEKHRRESTTVEYFAKTLLDKVNPRLARELVELFEEFETGETKEAAFVRDLDTYDMLLQAFEYEKESKGVKKLDGFMKSEARLTTADVKQWARELVEERTQFWQSLSAKTTGPKVTNIQNCQMSTVKCQCLRDAAPRLLRPALRKHRQPSAIPFDISDLPSHQLDASLSLLSPVDRIGSSSYRHFFIVGFSSTDWLYLAGDPIADAKVTEQGNQGGRNCQHRAGAPTRSLARDLVFTCGIATLDLGFRNLRELHHFQSRFSRYPRVLITFLFSPDARTLITHTPPYSLPLRPAASNFQYARNVYRSPKGHAVLPTVGNPACDADVDSRRTAVTLEFRSVGIERFSGSGKYDTQGEETCAEILGSAVDGAEDYRPSRIHGGMTPSAVFYGSVLHMSILGPKANRVLREIRDLPGGFMILFAWTFISAFPPLIGYSTSVTLAGFIFGLPNGWYIAASGTVVGSTAAFIACRVYFRNFAQKMVATDKRFAALSLTLKHDGLKLLCMIRLCPLPYSISNAALSTFPTVSPLNFAIAGAVASPKLLIHVFIGHQMKVLGDSGQKMTAGTKALNYGSIIGGSILGFVTGWLIYKRTVARAKQLEADERRRAREITGHAGGVSEHELETDQEGYFDDPVEAQAERTLSGDGAEGRYVDEEGEAAKKNGLAGRALSAFNDLFGRTARDGGYETEEEEEGRLLAGDELMDDDEDAEELLVVEDGVVELEEGGRRFGGRTNSRGPRK
ncbi:hypothetical protein Dda_6627 [Drechslerella dactyloides]|uniref:Golgi apparatus membrane protein TVP38 n=1 Tax=Drechslerella dactyloides TaxID=74499 RepID=A0AAD6NGD2_DREDA|nr:hypothetical protein Dda_6627 [Drechslerella dactyloides]